MSISEQVNKLREAVKSYRPYVPYYVIGLLHNAADTIESLSEKLEDFERSAEEEKVWRYCAECKHYTPLPNGVRGGKRGYCEKRYPRDSRRGCIRACKIFSEKDNMNDP